MEAYSCSQARLDVPVRGGVLEDGGSVAGIVYFESVTGRESAVELEMTLVDSSDVGRVAIPFQMRQKAAQEESRR